MFNKKPKACWILCTPRTGSSFLCELLNNSDAFPPFVHSRMKTNRGPLEIGQSFGEWSRLYDNLNQFLANPPPYAKMIFHQYVEAISGINKEERYNPGWYNFKHDDEMLQNKSKKYNSCFVKSIFPDMRYLLLKRNSISHAVSLYFARMTKKYHIYDSRSLQEYLNTNIVSNDELLMEAYKDALSYNSSWNNFFVDDDKYLVIDYDLLSSNPLECLNQISDFLNLKLNKQKALDIALGDQRRIYRMTRPESVQFEKRIKLLSTKIV